MTTIYVVDGGDYSIEPQAFVRKRDALKLAQECADGDVEVTVTQVKLAALPKRELSAALFNRKEYAGERTVIYPVMPGSGD